MTVPPNPEFLGHDVVMIVGPKPPAEPEECAECLTDADLIYFDRSVSAVHDLAEAENPSINESYQEESRKGLASRVR